jgi:23S rRNA pseudouridine2605 synthase
MAEERLQKALARAGFGSRRACEELIAAGAVTLNGTVATVGDKVDPTSDEVQLRGVRVNLDPDVRYMAFHKPRAVVTTMRDPQGRRDVRAYLPAEGPRVFPVGRLDRDSEGLLLLTNDGELANLLTHPRYGVEKEYLVEVEGRPSSSHLGRIRAGVDLDDGPARVAAVRVVDVRGDRGQLRVVMTEGRKREVRRLLAAVGLPVRRLVRLRIGPIVLGGLAPGATRDLTSEEVLALTKLAAKAERRARHASSAEPPGLERTRYVGGPLAARGGGTPGSGPTTETTGEQA